MLRQGLRFLVVGGLNTGFTYGLYCLLVIWWHPQLAWLSVVAIGLALGFYSHTRLVFNGRLGHRKAVAYTLMHLMLYALSSAVIFLSMHIAEVGPRVAAAVAIVINLPITFVLSRRILSDRPPAVEPKHA
jgi:putative flippase GtrA